MTPERTRTYRCGCDRANPRCEACNRCQGHCLCPGAGAVQSSRHSRRRAGMRIDAALAALVLARLAGIHAAVPTREK